MDLLLQMSSVCRRWLVFQLLFKWPQFDHNCGSQVWKVTIFCDPLTDWVHSCDTSFFRSTEFARVDCRPADYGVYGKKHKEAQCTEIQNKKVQFKHDIWQATTILFKVNFKQTNFWKQPVKLKRQVLCKYYQYTSSIHVPLSLIQI